MIRAALAPLCEDAFDPMKWTEPLHGKAKIAAAGKVLAERKKPYDGMSWEQAVDIAANWRSSHGWPLHAVYMTLRNRATKEDAEATIARRLKRLPSIVSKLKYKPTMQLSQMQDLGGCRAVVSSIYQVHKLVAKYESNPPAAATILWKKDYIKDPKPDGYRGVHLICEYRTGYELRKNYNGSRIEIQIRSRLQHTWATSVEIIDTFTGQNLKSGDGEAVWARFFVLLGSVLDAIDEDKVAANTYGDAQELTALCDAHDIGGTLLGIHTGLKVIEEGYPPGVQSFILVLKQDIQQVEIIGASSERHASEVYLILEKQYLDDKRVQVVAASAGSVNNLRKAYPNYYLDTGGLIRLLATIKKEIKILE